MKSSYQYKILTFLFVFAFTSCNDDDGTPLPAEQYLQITNLHAPMTGGQGQEPSSGSYTKFDFATASVTTSDTDWDIAFRATSIIFNGGTSTGDADEPERNGNAAAYIKSLPFSEVTSVVVSDFTQDSLEEGLAIPTGSGNGWYTYTGPPEHLILPIPGKTLVIRTRDLKYAKVEILSYYKDLDDSVAGNARYYTFNYLYNANENETTF